jgi:ATP-grasp domain
MQRGDSISKNQGETAPRILLTHTLRWAGSARLAMALSRAGCRVSAVCPTRGHPLRYTRVVRQTFPYSSFHPLESLMAAIEATAPEFIIPCDDLGVEHLHQLFARVRSEATVGSKMAALIERSLGSPESYPIVSSRYDLLRIAREEGIRLPDTILIKTADDLKDWQEGHGFPWVLKADGTYGGRGVKIAQSREQAEQFFRDLNLPYRTSRVIKRLIVDRDAFWLRPWWNRSQRCVIAQAHIQGRPANCAAVCWEGKVLAAIGVEVVSSEGFTGSASVVRVVDSNEMMLAAERIAHRLGLSGFFGLDFMVEKGSGVTYLIEMNPRCVPLCHLQLGTGRDLVGSLRAQLTSQPLREIRSVTQNDLIAYFPQALRQRSEFLHSAFLDIPQGEVDLVRELLRPWPGRSLLSRLGHKLTMAARRRSFRDR